MQFKPNAHTTCLCCCTLAQKGGTQQRHPCRPTLYVPAIGLRCTSDKASRNTSTQTQTSPSELKKNIRPPRRESTRYFGSAATLAPVVRPMVKLRLPRHSTSSAKTLPKSFRLP